ncbi:YfjI family protein [Mycolicibacterium tusciae]|uniref:DNA primase n=1 Tax=Mycolicibacterium tusciae TaxID=75922 RepID=A0A1X0K1V0_9MYCO|nr:YfjI family protein [Mycolicibacterium tusciae]ORB68805.1 hypothetical protein BST47_02660 [Mycolicibacterium tusciae]
MIDADTVDPMYEESPIDGPLPLTAKVAVPPFPTGALPEPIAAMVRGVAEATQTDPAMAATSALSAMSACTGGHAEIEIRYGWREPLVLYTATIAASGERKSAVQSSMTRPILDVEKQLAAETAAARKEASERKEIASKAVERQRNIAARADGAEQDQAFADVIGAAMIADSIEVPPIPRLVADDITPEAAASLLAEQRGRLAIISAEGGIFDIIAGRYSRSVPNLDLWLKGHSGDPLRVDRKSRPPEYVERPALTLGLMIQPQVLSAIAANQEFRGRGLLARFLYAAPVSKVGRRKIGAAPIGPEVEERYRVTVSRLVKGMVGWAGDPLILRLTPTAQQAMSEIEAEIEPTLAGEGELAPLADWGAKFLGAIGRIAGILHLAGLGADHGPRKPVEVSTVLAAARIGAYFKASAINAFIAMGTDQTTADASYLLERIWRLNKDAVSVRDAFTAASRARFRTTAALKPALDRLVDHGYLVPLPEAAPTGGRPASQRFAVAAQAAQAAKGVS